MNNLYKTVLSLCGLFIISIASVQAQLQFPELILDNDGLELDDSYTVSFTDEQVLPGTFSIQRILDNTGEPDLNDMYLFNSGLGLFYASKGYLIEFDDNTAVVMVSLTDLSNSDYKITAYYRLEGGTTWSQLLEDSTAPVGFRDDYLNGVDPNSLTYYLLDNSESFLYGAGLLKGTEINISHAPLNNYYYYEVGVGTTANDIRSGGNGWFYTEGNLVVNSEGTDAPVITETSNVQGGFKHVFTDIYAELYLRTYTIIDEDGNEFTEEIYKVLTPSCLADFDQNGSVTSSDLSVILADYGCLVNCPSDLTNDGAVQINDLSLFLALFGTECE